MSKADMIKSISKETGIDQSTVSLVVDQFVKSIVDELKSELKVSIKELGKFTMKHREPRQARNPRTGEAIMTEAKNVVSFTASSALNESINS